MQDVYNNYEQPITIMKRLSEMNIPFAFSHLKLDGSVSRIRKAELRPQSMSSKDKFSRYKLQYTNIETGEKRSCYIPLLLTLNNKQILLG